MKKAVNNFMDMVESSSDSFNVLLDSKRKVLKDGTEFDVDLDDVEVEEQYRKNFEDAEYTLQELGDSMKVYQIHPITVRPNRKGRKKPYLLVSGGRREKAAKLVGMTQLRAVYRILDDEAAERYRAAENIHTLPVKEIDEARAIQAFLNKEGNTIQKYLKEYDKSASWVSKRLALLNLPEQTERLVTEKISKDVELIAKVKKFEHKHPEKAEKVVKLLKENKEETNPKKIRDARKIVDEAIQEVIPKKEKPVRGTFDFFADAKTNNPHAVLTLDFLYVQVTEKKLAPEIVVNDLTKDERSDCELILSSFYNLGKMNKSKVINLVAQGMKNNAFAETGGGFLSLAALLQGATTKDSFSITGVLNCLVG